MAAHAGLRVARRGHELNTGYAPCRARGALAALACLFASARALGTDGRGSYGQRPEPASGDEAAFTPRRLAEIGATSQNWAFPAGTTLSIGDVNASAQEITLKATILYQSLQIEVPAPSTFGNAHTSPAIKLVHSGTDRGSCWSASVDVPTGSINTMVNLDLVVGVPLALVKSPNNLTASSPTLRFMHGGVFQLCYAPDGTMMVDSASVNNILPPTLRVIGVGSTCNTQHCLFQEKWHCHFAYKAATQPTCALLSGIAGARSGWSVTSEGASRVAWTQAFPADSVDADGQLGAENAHMCTVNDPEATILDAVPGGGFGLDLANSQAVFPAPVATTAGAFTVALCYCPNTNYGGTNVCDHRYDFVQQFGRLHFWTLRICDIAANDASCASRYMRVMPQQPFSLRVLCPPGGGCVSGPALNEVRLLAPSAATALPSWDSSHGCRASVSGSGSAAAIWPGGTGTWGGSRVDYKEFSAAQPPYLSLSVDSTLEVCYCNTGCSAAANWIHVGKVQTVQAFAIASRTAASGAGLGVIEYTGKSGGLALYGGVVSTGSVMDPYDAQRFTSSSLLQLLSFDRAATYAGGQTLEQHLGADAAEGLDFQSSMDSECQRELYQDGLVQGPSDKEAAAQYMAVANHSQFLAFDGPGHNLSMTPLQAGVLVVCYCGRTDASGSYAACGGPGAAWVFAGRLTIRGPRGDQLWSVTHGVGFGLTVSGWGFDGTGHLRILDAGGNCSSGGASGPAGTRVRFIMGCPSVGGSTCGQPFTAHEITLHQVHATSGTSPIYVTAASVSATQTTLTFSAAVTSVLATGDVISLGLDAIQVGGVSRSSWTKVDSYAAQRLAGLYDFPDDTSHAARVLGHKVTLTSGVDDQVTIPVGWAVDPGFSFAGSQGLWERHNTVSTAEELRGNGAYSGLVVCWVASGAGMDSYATAGTLDIVDPPAMAYARAGLTTLAVGAAAPVIVSFGTGASAAGYAAGTGRTTLRLKFLDVGGSDTSMTGKLAPVEADSGSPSGSVPWLPSGTSVALADLSQSVCGQLFLELWTSDDSGFPMPSGCYYGRRYQDAGSASYWRELFVVFSAGSGLKHTCQSGGATASCDYQLVLNAAVGTISNGEALAHLDTFCTDCSTPYQVTERGTATASYPSLGAATATDPQLHADGLELLGVDSDLVQTLGSATTLRLRLRGTSSTIPGQRITAGCFLRLYLWPLTLWASTGSSTCTAECSAYDFYTTCGPTMDCEMQDVAGPDAAERHYNLVKMRLPSNMDPATANVAHEITVQQLAVPARGMFPTRFGVQLSNAQDQRPFYTTSKGYLFKVPVAGETTGRLVSSGRTGYGSQPFVGGANNSVVARLWFGATLRHSGVIDSAMIRVTPPADTPCGEFVSVLTAGAGGSPAATASVFAVDSDADGYTDNPYAPLSTDALVGQWARNGATCEYAPAAKMTLFAGVPFYVQIYVDNPSYALAAHATSNRWNVELLGKGASSRSAPWSMGAVSFITAAEAAALGPSLWASSYAVMGAMAAAEQAAQPTSFAQGASHSVALFFKPAVGTGDGGSVVVDAPAGFDFGGACAAADLDAGYYALPNVGLPATSRLPTIVSCTGSAWSAGAAGSDRAQVFVQRNLVGGETYGFSLDVENPAQYDAVAQGSGWFVWIRDSQGSGIEGAQEPLNFNPLGTSAVSWQTYGAALNGFQVAFPGTLARPTSLSGAPAEVRFLGIAVPQDGAHTLRITAPAGFKFGNSSGVLHFTNQTAGLAVDFPAEPQVGQENELLWLSTSFTGGVQYGFEVQMRVPDWPTTSSAQSFFIEFGYDADALPARLQGGVVAAPAVQSLRNCAVGHDGNTMGWVHYMDVTVETITAAPSGGGLTVESAVAGFQLECPPVVVDTASSLPSDVGCSTGTSPPRVALTAGASGIPAGFYRFRIKTTNPQGPQAAGTWTFSSYSSGVNASYTPSGPLDLAAQALGFEINTAMADARLVSPSEALGRVDRPGQANLLTFAFNLSTQPASGGGDLLLRCPPEIVFDEDCLPRVETDLVAIFGSGAQHSYEGFPTVAQPTACVASSQQVRITLGSNLDQHRLYAFRIGIAQNPLQTPAQNIWTMEYAGETSTQIAGFGVWTFAGAAVLPMSTSRPAQCGGCSDTPLLVRFNAHNDVPAGGGLLVLAAPSGFSFRTIFPPSYTCVDELSAIDFNGRFLYDVADFKCSLDFNGRLVLKNMGAQRLRAGLPHNLTIHVINPDAPLGASSWRLQSYTAEPPEDANALDDVTLTGFGITEVFERWSVSNEGGTRQGGHNVTVRCQLSPRTAILPGDVLVVAAPGGFAQSDAGGGCAGFQWLTSGVSWAPRCPCDAGSHGTFIQGVPNCALSFQSSSGSSAVSSGSILEFKFEGTNPLLYPGIVGNSWEVQHWRGGAILASRAVDSWDILPQLEHVDVQVTGVLHAAGSLTAIQLDFLPVSNASWISVIARSPPGFDFDAAGVASPLGVDNATGGETIIIEADVVEGQAMNISISGVRLPMASGQSVFDIFTYADASLAVQRDEVREFSGGLWVPGKATVSQTQYLYGYDATQQPVRALLDPRVNEEAWIRLTVTFAERVLNGDVLAVRSTGTAVYQLMGASLVVEVAGSALSTTALQSPSQRELRFQFNDGIQQQTACQIRFRALPTVPGPSVWHVETNDGNAGYLTNANDAEDFGFRPVDQLQFSLRVPSYLPPKAVVAVTLTLSTLAGPGPFMLVAPEGFRFPSNCGQRCTPNGLFNGTTRETAMLMKTYPLGWAFSIQFELSDITHADRPWFTLARDDNNTETLGWGGIQFPVLNSMVGVSFQYSALAGRSTRVVINFQVIAAADASRIVARAPLGYILSCSGAGGMLQISLPGGRPYCTDLAGAGHLPQLQREITVDVNGTTLGIGEYAIGVACDIPDEAVAVSGGSGSTDATWSLELRDAGGAIVDSIFRVAARPIGNYPVTNPVLAWSRSEADLDSIVTFSLTFGQNLQGVGALLFGCPERVLHNIRSPGEFEILSTGFPSAGLDLLHMSLVRLFVTTGGTIPAGTHNFRFQVLLPTELPPRNVWYIALCQGTNCLSPDDPDVMISFVLAGFVFGDIFTSSIPTALASFALGPAQPSRSLWFAAVLMCALGALWEPRSPAAPPGA